MRRKAVFLSADYTIRNGQTYARLFLKGKTAVTLYYPYDPYFYVEAGEGRKGEIEKVVAKAKDGSVVYPKKVEKVEKLLKGKKSPLLKVYCNRPGDVPVLGDAVPHPCYEYSIPYGRRFMMDFGLVPFSVISYEREGRVIKEFLGSREGDPLSLNRLAFDTEVYNPIGAPRPAKDPLLMVSYKDSGEEGVICYKDGEKGFLTKAGDEKELLEKFFVLLQERDADVLYGYNTTNFDLPYMRERAKKLGVQLALGRDGKGYREKKKGLIMPLNVRGRIHVDLYPVMKFFGFTGMIKTDDYTLKNVYAAATGKKKKMVERLDIWKMWDGGDLGELFEYSLEDARATYELGELAYPMLSELSTIARLPLFDVAYSSSGQLVESLLMYEANRKGIVIPPRPSGSAVAARLANPIKGAYVKLPEPGIYENIAVFDFRGLYPSIICSYNIDPDMLVEEGGVESPAGSRFAQEPRGLIPEVLEGLVDKRVEIKRQLRGVPREGREHTMLSARSHALKILANSFYGYLGYARSRWYNRNCAESVTAWGRQHITEAEKKAEEAGFRVLYMDSITEERFIPILYPNGNLTVKNIGQFFEENSTKLKHYGGKERIPLKGYKTLTADPETGKSFWGEITQIIRHSTNKKIYRVNQKWGETRVTEDHSLITKEKNEYTEVKPRNIETKDLAIVEKIPPVKRIQCIDLYEMLKTYTYRSVYKGRAKTARIKKDDESCWFSWTERKKPVMVKRFIRTNSKEFEYLCRLLGAYISEGSSSTAETSLYKNGASISSSDKRWLRQLQKDYHSLFKNAKTAIIPSDAKKTRVLEYSSGDKKRRIEYEDKTYKLQMMNGLSAVFFKMLCGQKSSGKRIPDFVFNVEERHKRLLLEHMLIGDGSVTKDQRYTKSYKKKNFTYTTKSLHLVSGLSLLLRQLQQKHTINYRPSKSTYAMITSSRYNKRLNTKVKEEQYSGYVYDLSVKGSHMFVDACGQILLHNTDSLFLLMGEKGKEDALRFLEKMNSELPEKMELELEGFYTRGVFVSKKSTELGAKKKYALIEEDGRIKIRGFELVRRDWSNIAKDTQKRVLEAILKEGSSSKAATIVQEVVERLRAGEVAMEDLAIYTQLKKDPGKYEIMSPELSAVQKANERGKRVGRGSIIAYVITRRGKSISEKAELLEFAEDYDPGYYINNQVMPSVLKILKELGYDEYALKHGGKQKDLSSFF